MAKGKWDDEFKKIKSIIVWLIWQDITIQLWVKIAWVVVEADKSKGNNKIL